MRAQQSFLRRYRRFGAHEACEARVVKRAQNGAKSLRPLDMRRPHVMRERSRMCDEQGRGRRGSRAEGEACASAGDCFSARKGGATLSSHFPGPWLQAYSIGSPGGRVSRIWI